MLSTRLIRQLAQSALLDRPLILPCVQLSTQFRPRPSVNCLRARAPPNQATSRASSSSSTRWKNRQGRDRFAKEARVAAWKSRAAFKLLEMNEKYRLFRAGNTVVDLGYAPGSWSQVAINRTSPNGRVVGIDIIPAQPPRGVSTIQGNFLSPAVQAEVRAYVQDPARGRPIQRHGFSATDRGISAEELESQETSYLDRERHASLIPDPSPGDAEKDVENDAAAANKWVSKRERDDRLGRVVNVVLSDMSEPWSQTQSFYVRSVTEPYLRMMNTSGNAFRDHAGSMDLCLAALEFAFDTLREGGHFVCKFYQGGEDKAFEKKLRKLFERVHREKPESSRSESKEAFFVALKRKADATKEEVFRE
ncbi:FtsJ-domain-containing protein [Saccharata proteae CBS 121410]|uniref:rRNA methyltransferase 2, mitochondrial n=1 Tax=Saccharata proteae CBS 121410 TaxID=1314787 RepID=A0A9P4LWK1_9PEZI|nr:FtsJ-domain-containing protein [Saccharata proteae CBS 121410]